MHAQSLATLAGWLDGSGLHPDTERDADLLSAAAFHHSYRHLISIVPGISSSIYFLIEPNADRFFVRLRLERFSWIPFSGKSGSELENPVLPSPDCNPFRLHCDIAR